jgi:hypothetical protein
MLDGEEGFEPQLFSVFDLRPHLPVCVVIIAVGPRPRQLYFI